MNAVILRTLSIFPLLSLAACGQLHPLTGVDDTGADDTGVEDTDVPDDTGADDTATDDTGMDDTGTDDTGTDDTGTDTGDPPADLPPELLSFSVTDAGGGIADIAFEGHDPDDALARLRLTVDGSDHDLFIPDDIDVYNPGGVSHVYWDVSSGGTCSSVSSTFEGWLFDELGHPSNGMSDTLTIAGTGGLGGAELEPNEWRSEATWIGPLSRSATLTGSADDFGDDDYLAFIPCDSGTWQFTLDWTGGDDGSLMLYLYDGPSGLSVADDFGFSQPKQISWTLNAGQTYYLNVSAFDAISSWTITAQ